MAFLNHGSPAGRLLRIVVDRADRGRPLGIGGTGGIVVAIIGLAPLAAGVSTSVWPGRCLSAPLRGVDICQRK